MLSIESPAEMARWSAAAHARGESIAFVPTMGFLHEGHLSLMREGARRAQNLVASIFVNPLQFGPREDLDRYPRDPDGDAAKCRSAGVGVLFVPSAQTMYPAGFQTTVKTGPLASGLCGASRPGHFDGVATVVLKLFNLVRPHVALFGEKDYQQLAVLRRMARDLDLGIEIAGMPIVREPDGLAMSSRNAYLSPDDRLQALALSQSLSFAESQVGSGERDPARIEQDVRSQLARSPRASIDYVALVDADTLQPLSGPLARPAVLALAVRFGATRLIDNRVLRP
jgi:pantoate--beta-alanine ligase